jgi:uncharacterized repeat protein (TIGR01451 family)
MGAGRPEEPAMKCKQTAMLTTLAGALVLGSSAFAVPTVYPEGVTIHEAGVEEGYLLFDGADDRQHLIDVNGVEVHTWTPQCATRGPSKAVDGGHVLIGCQNRLVEIDWDSNVVREFFPPPGAGFHHDWHRLPNGNTLILSQQTINDPAISDLAIADDFILEVSPAGDIVWEWHTTDHFDEFGFSQERIDQIFARGGGWSHANTISPIPDNTSHSDPRFSPGNIIVSYRFQNTIAIVDRVTGEIVWVLSDTTIGQHDSHMLPDDVPGGGNILVFDNGDTGNWTLVPNRFYSRILEIDPVSGAIPYTYTAADSGLPDETFLSNFQSGARRLSNGNTFICESRWGRVFEITDSGDLVWEYVSPYLDANDYNGIYRAYKVPLEWAGPQFVPDLVVTGAVDPDPVQVGEDFEYTIRVENVGAEPAVSVELAEATPAGTTFRSISAPLGWDCATPPVGGTGPITCSRSSLSAGAVETLTLVVRADLCHVDGTTITNTATVASLGSEATPGDNSTTIVTTGASDTVVPDLAASLVNAGQDVQLEWGDSAPACGYRVMRSTTPDGGFVDASGALFDNSFTDVDAGTSPESFYYLIRID